MHGEHTSTTRIAVARNRARLTVPRNRAHLTFPRNRARLTVPPNRRLIAMLAATLTVALTMLTACTGDPAPVTTPTVTTPAVTGSTTTAPTTPEPTKPVEKATPESAIQFTRYFWDLYNYAYQTYDTAPLKAISDPACSFCEELLRDIAKTADAHTRISGYELALTEAASPPVKISSGTLVIGTLTQKPGRATGPDGAYTSLPGFKSVKSTVALKWIDNSWHIEGITNDPKTRKAWGA